MLRWDVEKIWPQFGGDLRKLGSGHVAQLAEDKIYYSGGNYFEGLVEVDTVLFERMNNAYILSENSVRKVEMFNQGPSAREYMTSVFASWRNQVITFGGRNRRTKQCSNEVHALDLETKAWTKLVLRGVSPQRRTLHSATLLRTKMYIHGGYIEDKRYLGDLWIAELGNQCAPYWSMVKIKATSPPPRIFARLNNLNGVLILFGGWQWSKQRKLIKAYVPTAEKWDDVSGPSSAIISDNSKQDKFISVTTSQGIIFIAAGKKPCLLRQDKA